MAMFGKSRQRGRWPSTNPIGGPCGAEASAEADYYDALRRFGHHSAESEAARQRWSSIRHRRRHNLAG